MDVRLVGGIQTGIPEASVKNPAANPPLKIKSVEEVKEAELKGVQVSIGEEQLIKTIEKVNKKLQGIPTSLEFVIHEKTHDIMIKVINQETGEVIREIPPEKILDMVANFLEMAGLIVDERR